MFYKNFIMHKCLSHLNSFNTPSSNDVSLKAAAFSNHLNSESLLRGLKKTVNFSSSD